MVRLLLEAAPATAMAVDSVGYTPLHHAAGCQNIEVERLLLSAAPAAATMPNAIKRAPIHRAACRCKTAGMQLLLPVEVAPELAFAQDEVGDTPLHWPLDQVPDYGFWRTEQQVLETARCLGRAAPAAQPALKILLQYSSALRASLPIWGLA